ncbi:VOC family protein [Chitinophaga arvensicola]|uniref:VOC domain-containing protein n=1 Tax=Chitinophaga arvensicola TaxID=29529 RepID=A0A1I0S8V8_9BACT|nr:VOC family protein [Chitinophaga arvensicola]SEW52516.1 hypothetical protein SAMN04488122_4894 [Chitinophaga arvensicola]
MPHLHLIVIKTSQPDLLSGFYTSLGFQFHYHRHGNGPFHYASVGEGPLLEIYPLPKNVTVADHTTRLGFTVANVDDILQKLPEATIISAPELTEWGYSAIIQDPDGRKIELLQA